jgi:predicted ATPase
MKETIHIKNFGPIKDVYIENIKPLTVFVGESGSGKSTIMKVIALFRWIYKMHNIRSYLKRSNILKSPFRFRMDSYLKESGLLEYIKDNTEIDYSVEFERKVYKINFRKNKLLGTNDSNIVKLEDLYFTKISYISENRNLIPLWAEKGAALAGIYLGFYFHEVFNDFVLATDYIKDLDIKYLNLKFSVKKVQSNKKYLIKDENNKYELTYKNSSSGIINSIPITLIAEYFSKHFDFEEAFNKSLINFLFNTDKLIDFKPVKNIGDIKKKLFIHIEEPELSLFPDAQCELVSDLISKCFVNNKNTISLMFSTHSPYIINYLNLLIKAYYSNKLVNGAKISFDDVVVFLVEDGKIQNLMIEESKIINTNILSDTINDIYDRYNELEKNDGEFS